jgi:LPS-assembly protein
MAGVSTSLKPSRNRRLLGAVASIALLAAIGQGTTTAALSQTLNDQVAQRGTQQKGRLLVEAKEVVYDNDSEKVEARGDVQLYYQGRILEADRVIYDRKTKRVYAEGNAKLVETNGQILYSNKFELTDDFRDGFIDSLRLVSPDKQRITAARGERTDGETTVFERGTYTACEPCKDNPEKPPLWQVKAARIIAKNSEQMIYYEDARFEFFGLPVAYIPYFSAPDPTVSRKSGLLTPTYTRNSALGYGASLPIYFALAPNYDVLWTPTALSRQGMFNQAEWRHRLETGVYNIRASGIFQADPSAYLPGPFGPNKPRAETAALVAGFPDLATAKVDKRVFRGSIESTGKFLINKNWTFGWDVALTSDKFYLNNYKIKSESVQTNYFKESVSSVYLRGKTDRAFFDMTGYYFQGQTFLDWQKQSAVVHPVLDYNRRFTPDVIGGELAVDVNAVSMTREVADYVPLPNAAQRFPSSTQSPTGVGSRWLTGNPLFTYYIGKTAYSAYQACVIYERGNCLLRGAAGNINRASTTISWRRTFIDPLGQSWTPFVSAQFDVLNHTLDRTGVATNPSNAIFGNDKQTNFIAGSETSARAMPAIGLEYRYPFVASTSWGTHLFEPIAQIIVRPNEQRIGKTANEDSQSLVFSDSNLFSLNKFSGYDRTEGGVRANAGAQYTATFANGAYANMLVGQSYQLAGRNSFEAGRGYTDLVNTGLDSGLDKTRSDYVTRFAFTPNKQLSFVARGRFDDASLKLKRLELSSTVVTGSLTTSVVYARQDAQPDLGFVRRREGLLLSNSLTLPNNWYVTGSVLVDLDRYLYDRDLYAVSAPGTLPNYNRSLFRPATVALGLGYSDECTKFSISYVRSVAESLGAAKTTNSTVLFKLELTHLGQLNYRQNLNPSATADGTR